jgi:hypothetical protein
MGNMEILRINLRVEIRSCSLGRNGVPQVNDQGQDFEIYGIGI